MNIPADNSRGAANSSIVDALRGAGEIGLHIDDIVELSGLKEKKDVQPRLWALLNRGCIQQVPLEQKWKISKTPDTAYTTLKSDLFTQNAETPPAVDLPTINLPHSGKFSSYKNSLQEYCQKLHLPVPQYNSTRGSYGLMGCVKFASKSVSAAKATDTVKEADQRAAFQALKQLGYLDKSCTYENLNTLKRKDGGTEGTPPQKQTCVGSDAKLHGTYKSQLNELAQKNKLATPVYETVGSPQGFVSTVTFNGRQFKCISPCAKKKDAEKDAAHMAMHIIAGVPIENADQAAEQSASLDQTDVSNMITEARQEASNSSGVVSPKNRLQEYCQRLKKPLPEYETNSDGGGLYSTTVTVEGKTFTSDARQSKKLAERSAAEMALKELGLMV